MFINIYEEIYRVVHLFFNKKDAERGHVPQFRKVYLKLNASGLQKWRFYLAPVIFWVTKDCVSILSPRDANG